MIASQLSLSGNFLTSLAEQFATSHSLCLFTSHSLRLSVSIASKAQTFKSSTTMRGFFYGQTDSTHSLGFSTTTMTGRSIRPRRKPIGQGDAHDACLGRQRRHKADIPGCHNTSEDKPPEDTTILELKVPTNQRQT